tara:strand:- start:16 stop:372 length:357 start_codon:yes stop_codon:yes gene_type:complete
VKSKYIRFEGRSFPNTHGGKLKLLENLLSRWSLNFNPPLDSYDGRMYMKDKDWIEKQLDEYIPEHGKNGLTKSKIKTANKIFKRYGGRNLQYEMVQDFTTMKAGVDAGGEPVIRKKVK